jgi:hypothetical protein
MNTPLRMGVGANFKLRVPTIEWNPGARETSKANKTPRVTAMVPKNPRASHRFRWIPGMSNTRMALVRGNLLILSRIARITVYLGFEGQRYHTEATVFEQKPATTA